MILGAGASAEYGFPVGRYFRNDICSLVRGADFFLDMRELGLEEQAREFLDRFRHSAIGSPDRFLELHPEYLEAGKFCIAQILTAYEMDDRAFSLTGSDQPWYDFLVNCLDLDSPQYRHNALTILTFNYDRSLEYFLWKVFEARYFNDERKKRRLWRTKPKIIHLHGLLGAYDPIDGTGRPYAPAQSAEGVSEELVIAAEGIKIVHEVNPETEEFDEAEEVLREAKRIFFLGFGFDKRNVQRLRVFENKLDEVSIVGTGFGLSNADHGRIHSEVFNGHTNGRAFMARNIRSFLEDADLTWQRTR